MGNILAVILIVFPAVLLIREMFVFRKVSKNPQHPNYEIYRKGFYRRVKIAFLLMGSVALIQISDVIHNKAVQLSFYAAAILMVFLCFRNLLKEMQSVAKSAIKEHAKLSLESLKNLPTDQNAELSSLDKIIQEKLKEELNKETGEKK